MNNDWLLNMLTTDFAWSAFSLGTAAAVAAFFGIGRYLFRSRAEKRWLAALDNAYAKQEEAKLTDSSQGGLGGRLA
jgi:hypothetical protein